MMVSRSLAVGIAMAAATACSGSAPGPRPQWIVAMATDAPIPQFGDSLLVEVLQSDGTLACAGCRRVLPAGHAAQWPISFGMMDAEHSGPYHVRARLFRSDRAGADGVPQPDSAIDVLGRLPAADGVTTVGLELRMGCYGVSSDPVAGTCDPSSRTRIPEKELARISQPSELVATGSWPEARQVPCSGPVPQSMVCVPGGLFVLGNKQAFPMASEVASTPERLVRLSPFAMDVDELSVAAMRALVTEHGVPMPALHSDDPSTLRTMCTWLGVDNPANDALPANCLMMETARDACAALGKRLPTEAEWEYAAGNLSQETPFPWGTAGSNDSAVVCTHCVIGRAEFGMPGGDLTCRTSGGVELPAGPVPAGLALDVTALGLKNLSGNVSEWVSDRLARYDDACFEVGTFLLVDPRCDVGEGLAFRGGNWETFPLAARVFGRSGEAQGFASANVGFRCVQSM